MANVIDSSYFKQGDLYIPNNTDTNAGVVGESNQTDLDFYIVEYEGQLLINALGIELYEQLVSALSDLDGSNQKWKDLVNGKTYEDPNGVKKRWQGLRGENKQSLVACYVYTQYLRNYDETFATTGIVKNDSKNATNYDATPKYIKAYNKFLKQYQSQLSYAPNFYVNKFGNEGTDWYSSEEATVCLYQFLTDSNELDDTSFPNFVFKFYEEQNSFGI